MMLLSPPAPEPWMIKLAGSREYTVELNLTERGSGHSKSVVVDESAFAEARRATAASKIAASIALRRLQHSLSS